MADEPGSGPDDPTTATPLMIARTGQLAAAPWPAGTGIQGGRRYGATREGGDGLGYFVEVSPGGTGFIRGHGVDVAAAEAAAYARHAAGLACPGHQWETRDFTNGAGFCQLCSTFASGVFTGEQLGQRCSTCGAGTTYGRYGPDAYWDASREQIINPGDPAGHQWRCAEHAPFRAQYAAWLRQLGEIDEDEVVVGIGEILSRMAAAVTIPDEPADRDRPTASP